VPRHQKAPPELSTVKLTEALKFCKAAKRALDEDCMGREFALSIYEAQEALSRAAQFIAEVRDERKGKL
jgi:hypothetical protein